MRPADPPKATYDFNLDFRSDRLERLLGMWRDRLPADGKLPPRADFDPLDLREHLGWLVVAEVVPDRSDVVFRLVGTHLVELAGRDATGLRSAEAHSPEMAAVFSYAIANPRPMRIAGTVDLHDRAICHYETLVLPLANDGARVDRLLLGVDVRTET